MGRLKFFTLLVFALAAGAVAIDAADQWFIGSAANDGTGETLRSAFDKINTNFSTLFGGKIDSTNGGGRNLSLFGPNGGGLALRIGDGGSVWLTNGSQIFQQGTVLFGYPATGPNNAVQVQFSTNSYISDFLSTKRWNFKSAAQGGTDSDTVATLADVAAAGGGSFAVTNGVDVLIAGLAEGQVLFWNDTIKKWTNGTISAGATVSDIALAASWNGVTGTAPSKNAVYDYLHILSPSDNGKAGVLDQATGIANTGSGGALLTPITTSAGLAAVLSDETGSGPNVFAFGPALGSVTVQSNLNAATIVGTNTIQGQAGLNLAGTANVNALNSTGAVTAASANIAGAVNVNSLTATNGIVNQAGENVTGTANISTLNATNTIVGRSGLNLTGGANVNSLTSTGAISGQATINIAGAATFASSVNADNVTSTNNFVGRSGLNLAGTANVNALNSTGAVTAASANIAGAVNVNSLTASNGIVNQAGENVTGTANISTLNASNTIVGRAGLNLAGAANVNSLVVTGQTTLSSLPANNYLVVDGNGKLTTLYGSSSNTFVQNFMTGFSKTKGKIQTNSTIYLNGFGDSLVTGQLFKPLADSFVNSYGFAGFQGEAGSAYGNNSWVATNTVDAALVANDFTAWFVSYWNITNGGKVAWFVTNSSVTGVKGINANIITVDYIEENGAGTFKIQTNAAPSGAWADFQTGINANNGGARHGVELRYTNAFTANMMVQIVTTAGNPVKIVGGPGLFLSPNRGTIINMFAQGGLGINQFTSVPTNITGPILSKWDPDLVVLKWLDSSAVFLSTLPTVNTFITNYIPNADILWVACNPTIGVGGTSDPIDVPYQNAITYMNAITNRQNYFDGWTPYGGTNVGVARGLLSPANDPHPTVSGDLYVADLVLQWAGFFNGDAKKYGNQFFTYGSTSITGTSNSWLQSYGSDGSPGIGMSLNLAWAPQGFYIQSPRVMIGGTPWTFTGTELLEVFGDVGIYNPGNLSIQLGNFTMFNGLQNQTWASATSVGYILNRPNASTTNQIELKDANGKISFSVGSNGVVQLQITNSATVYPASYRVFMMTANGANTNTTTTTNSWWGTGVGSRNLDPNFWEVGRRLDMEMEGDWWDAAANAPNRIMLMLNTSTATNIAAQVLAAPPLSVTAGDFFRLEAEMTCRTTGASGTVSTSGAITFNAGATNIIQRFTNIVLTVDTTVRTTPDVMSTNGATTFSVQPKSGSLMLR